MTYYKDLSRYAYHSGIFDAPITVNVGWISANHPFPVRNPSEELLDLVWEFCKISFAKTRGIHDCELCPTGNWHNAERRGEFLLLGSSEIRVFSNNDLIFAAPTLIFHYISVHHYSPPEEFIFALRNGPKPQSDEYFRKAESLGLEWAKTPAPTSGAARFRL